MTISLCNISQSLIFVFFILPCFASSEIEEGPLLSRGGSSLHPEKNDSQRRENIYEWNDSHEIYTLAQSVRKESYDEKVPFSAQKSSTSYSNIMCERTKFKYHFSFGLKGFSFYLEVDTAKVQPNNTEAAPFFDFSSFEDEVEWILV